MLLLTYLWVFPRSAWLYKVRSNADQTHIVDALVLRASTHYSAVQHTLRVMQSPESCHRLCSAWWRDP